MRPVARIHTDFPTKFGIPRQSGLVDELVGRVVFEPEFRVREAVRGLKAFSHIWLIWLFSEAVRDTWSPTARPPRLGGNERVGVFATRSPFRPNPIGLSCVRLERVDLDAADAPALIVRGADLMDGTPILDIKPYIPYADSQPEATGGFTGSVAFSHLKVDFPESLLSLLPPESRAAAIGVLSEDPRPAYQRKQDGRRYGIAFAGVDIRFVVEGDTLHVMEVVPVKTAKQS